jgi:hypothetical protein
MLKLPFQLQLFRKHVQHYLDFQRMLSSYLYKMVLNQLDVVELLKIIPTYMNTS